MGDFGDSRRCAGGSLFAARRPGTIRSALGLGGDAWIQPCNNQLQSFLFFGFRLLYVFSWKNIEMIRGFFQIIFFFRRKAAPPEDSGLLLYQYEGDYGVSLYI